MMMKPILEIYDIDGLPHRPAVRGLQFTKSMFGGEDLTLGFILDRSSAQEWPDVGYGYEVILRKGIDPVWVGRIRYIEQDLETISVTALGNWVYLDDFTYIGGGSYAGTKGRLWCDTRYGKWKQTTVEQVTYRNPERYQMDLRNRIWIAPREGEYLGPTMVGGQYYECKYDDIKRVTFTVGIQNFTGWDAQLKAWAGDWSAGDTLWQYSVDGTGAQDETLATERPIIEFQMWKTGAGDYTGDTGDTFLKISSLKIYGTTDVTPNVYDVARDIVNQLYTDTPIELDYTQIESVTLTLEPLFYEDGETCLDAFDDAASFGDQTNKDIAWGVESGGARIFVRRPDRDKVRYVVPPYYCRKLLARGETSRDYYSAATGRYTDKEGVTQHTDKYHAHVTMAGIVANTTSTGDDLASTMYGVRRETIVDFGRVSSGLATEFIKQFVIKHGHPRIFSTFEVVGAVQDLFAGGAWIEPYEVETGYLVQIPHFRAVEAEGASGVDLREWDTTFMLAGLRWDNDNYVATLIPEAATDDLRVIVHHVRRQRERGGAADRKKREARHRFGRRQIA